MRAWVQQLARRSTQAPGARIWVYFGSSCGVLEVWGCQGHVMLLCITRAHGMGGQRGRLTPRHVPTRAPGGHRGTAREIRVCPMSELGSTLVPDDDLGRSEHGMSMIWDLDTTLRPQTIATKSRILQYLGLTQRNQGYSDEQHHHISQGVLFFWSYGRLRKFVTRPPARLTYALLLRQTCRTAVHGISSARSETRPPRNGP